MFDSGFRFTVLCSVLLYSLSSAATDATARKDSQILAQPKANGSVVQSLKAGDSLSLGSRQGVWYSVDAPAVGWIKMTEVSVQSEGAGSSLAGLASGRSGSGNTVASSGARGLDGAAITTGEPDFEAVEELATLAEADTGLGGDFFADLPDREITEPTKDSDDR